MNVHGYCVGSIKIFTFCAEIVETKKIFVAFLNGCTAGTGKFVSVTEGFKFKH